MKLLLGLARIAALGGLLALAGCVTAENSLSQSDIADMKLTGVTVSLAPDARIQWEEAVRAYGVSKSLMDDQMMAASETPEGRAYIHAMLAPRIKTGLEQQLSRQLAGTRPVRLEITVKTFALASAATRIFIGGGRGMSADATLVDARTGKVLLVNPGLSAALVTGQGIVGTMVQAAVDSNSTQSPADKVIARYAEVYRNWLLKDRA